MKITDKEEKIFVGCKTRQEAELRFREYIIQYYLDRLPNDDLHEAEIEWFAERIDGYVQQVMGEFRKMLDELPLRVDETVH